MSRTQPPAGFDDLSVPEQIDYVNSLWERIASRPSEVPVPEWHHEVLASRLKQHRENSDDVQSWSDTRETVRNKLRQTRQ